MAALTAAHPTLVVGFGSGVQAAVALARRLDDGLDVEDERGVRILLADGTGQRLRGVTLAAAASLAEAAGRLLVELVETPAADVVPALAGVRLLVATDAIELSATVALLRAVQAGAADATVRSALAGRGGIQVRVVIGADDAAAGRSAWMAAWAPAPDSPTSTRRTEARAAAIVVPRNGSSYRLDDESHDVAFAMVLDLLVFEATGDVEGVLRLDARQPPQAWLPAELIDTAASLDEERRRQRFGAWVRRFLEEGGSAPLDGVASPPETAVRARADAAEPHLVVRAWQAEVADLETRACHAAERVGQRHREPAAAAAPDWATQVHTELAHELERTLDGAGETAAQRWRAAAGPALDHDAAWLAGLHLRMRHCGTGPLLATLGRWEQGLADGRAALPAPQPPAQPATALDLGALPALREEAVQRLGADPPLDAGHWMALPFLACGLATVPLWHALAAAVGAPDALLHSPLQQVLHAVVWYPCHDLVAVALGFGLGGFAWVAARRWVRARWELDRDEWRARFDAHLLLAAQHGGQLAHEKHRLAVRVHAARLASADAALHPLRKMARGVQATQRVVQWLARRFEARRPARALAPTWTLSAEVPHLRWALVPPEPADIPGPGEARRSLALTPAEGVPPWATVSVRADEPAAAQAFFLFPLQVWQHWERTVGAGEKGERFPLLPSADRALLAPFQPGRLARGATDREDFVQFVPPGLEQRLRTAAGDDALAHLRPANAPAPRRHVARRPDRLCVLTRLVSAEPEGHAP